jgi:hypothetical protein
MKKLQLPAKRAARTLKIPFALMTFEESSAALGGWLATYRESAYRIGDTLLSIQDLKLYEKGGFKSFSEYLDSLQGPSRRTLFRYMAYAYKVSAQIGAHHDPERIDLALRLLPQAARRLTVLNEKTLRAIEVPAVRRGKATTVLFAKATTEELERAVAELEERDGLVLPPAMERHEHELKRKFGAGPGALGDVRVVRRRGKHVFVLEVPAERAAELLRKLR